MILNVNTNLNKCCAGCDNNKQSLQVGFQNGTCVFGTPSVNLPLCQSFLSLPEGTGVSGGTSTLVLKPGEYKTLSSCETGNIQILQVPTGSSLYWRYKTPKVEYPCSPKSKSFNYSFKIVSITNVLSEFPSITLQLILAHKNTVDGTVEEETGMVTVIGKKVGKGLVKVESTITHSYNSRIFKFTLSGLQLLLIPGSLKDKISRIPGINETYLPEDDSREYILQYYKDIQTLNREENSVVYQQILDVLIAEVPGLSEADSLGKVPHLELTGVWVAGDVRATVISVSKDTVEYQVVDYFFEASPMVLLQAKDLAYDIELYNPMDANLIVTTLYLKIKDKKEDIIPIPTTKNTIPKKIGSAFGTTVEYSGN